MWVCDLQHSMGLEVVCRDNVLPLGWLMCTRNTSLTRVFLRPMSVSPLRSSMSELRSFRIPAQSILGRRQKREMFNIIFVDDITYSRYTQFGLQGFTAGLYADRMQLFFKYQPLLSLLLRGKVLCLLVCPMRPYFRKK